MAAELSFGVKDIVATNGAFAAIKEDNTVVTWGSSSKGGDISEVVSLANANGGDWNQSVTLMPSKMLFRLLILD